MEGIKRIVAHCSAPTNHEVLWLDTSVTPNVLKTYTKRGKWEPLSDDARQNNLIKEMQSVLEHAKEALNDPVSKTDVENTITDILTAQQANLSIDEETKKLTVDNKEGHIFSSKDSVNAINTFVQDAASTFGTNLEDISFTKDADGKWKASGNSTTIARAEDVAANMKNMEDRVQSPESDWEDID